MSTREIKVGDRLRWKLAQECDQMRGDDVFVVNAVDRENSLVWDSTGMSWSSVFSHPDDYEHVDEQQSDPVNHSARECHRITNTEAFANAELFAAAPELLACLEELVTLKDTKPHDYEERKAKAWRAAREAINKARGGK
jgi:hypothetical protein